VQATSVCGLELLVQASVCGLQLPGHSSNTAASIDVFSYTSTPVGIPIPNRGVGNRVLVIIAKPTRSIPTRGIGNYW
jgi:hypothetical protein